MGLARAQVSFERASLFPRDRITNTFHFITPTAGDVTTAEAAAITDALGNFFTGTSGGAVALQTLMPSPIYAVSGHRMKVYDLEDAIPRTPIRDITWTFTPGATSNPLPAEVALVLSIRANPVSGVPVARTRGRIYAGPFMSNQLLAGEATDTRPQPGLQNSLAQAGKRLMDDATVQWAVWSPTDLVARTVTSCKVDNAWDTQRSRGAAPTASVVVTAA